MPASAGKNTPIGLGLGFSLGVNNRPIVAA
jgi:hypothetical protein